MEYVGSDNDNDVNERNSCLFACFGSDDDNDDDDDNVSVQR
jgi:hypothetical protein